SDAIAQGVKVGDFFPAGLRERGREGMFGRDAGFRVEAREGLSAGRLLQERSTKTDLVLIPQGPVLFFEQQQAARPVDSRGQPGAVKMHEGKESKGFRSR